MKTLCALLLCFAAGLPAAVHAGDLLVQVPAVLDPAAPIASQVRAECAVPELVGKHVLAQLSQRLPNVRAATDVPAGATDPMLKLTLLNVSGAGGGGWSGSKLVVLKAELVENGRTVAVNTAQRRSRGGVFGGVSGTCPIFESIAEGLGKDVAAWVPIALADRDLARRAVPPATLPVAPAQ